MGLAPGPDGLGRLLSMWCEVGGGGRGDRAQSWLVGGEIVVAWVPGPDGLGRLLSMWCEVGAGGRRDCSRAFPGGRAESVRTGLRSLGRCRNPAV